ncbi:MAG: hypothetical protein K0R97_665 [Oerskovia sp.]|jgi:hypothetical protein|nr:hypothetical protein [Oerskovia sp.]
MSYPAVYRSVRQSESEFLADYDLSLANWADGQGTTLLMYALRNPEPASRAAIAGRLLDDGADPAATSGGTNALHVLLSATSHDFAAEAALLARLLEGGADINADTGDRWGTPLQTLARTFKFSDEELAPFYDVLFARPELDVTTPSHKGRSITESAQAAGEARAGLLKRCLAHAQANTAPLESR